MKISSLAFYFKEMCVSFNAYKGNDLDVVQEFLRIRVEIDGAGWVV